MFDNYLIEVSGKPAGIIARDTNGYRFHASESAFNDLDGQIFSDPQAAERAARKLLSNKHIAKRRPAGPPRDGQRTAEENGFVTA